ncbi:hypothetical protein ASPZODRAFT_133093 [Penicilliopsis zonata CBS 506.65]|uniref:Piwi domain-containing protein n=1 Tax=Penicilliopsis zonata CBS 506.65 TaxID=1073090 RepID=A0A1L9SG59_9EURO|nr:hypothetical protein ASPZODRAFT_133093 [Penicilliopsis zonata CBS 506.65]OJJ46103.1 hypothetical protein ASPZODRAFT_133093 [Penicilliopsis zonata CBS 506.65]
MYSQKDFGDSQRGGRGRGGDRGGGGGGGRGRGGDRGGDRGGNRGRGGGGRGAMDLPIRGGPPGGRGRGDGEFRGRGGRGGGDGDFRGRGRGGGDRGGRGGGGFRGRDQAPKKIYTPQNGQKAEPDMAVLKNENGIIESLKQKYSKAMRQAKYPERPGYGTQGQKILLYANYFELSSKAKELFRYHVDIAAEGGRTPTGKKAKQIVRLLLDEHFLQYQNSIATDYKSTLISHVELPKQEEYLVRYKDEYEDDYPEQPKVYRVSVQFTGNLRPSDLLDYLSSTNASAIFDSKAEVTQAMNIILGHDPKTDPRTVSLGANRHFSLMPNLMEKQSLGAGLEVLRGFFVSVRAATSRMLVNVQVKYIACYQEGELAKVIESYQYENSRNIYRLEAFLKKLKVQATHIVKKNKKGQDIPRYKTIAGLATQADGRSLENPPRVARHGAGPREVQFFLGGESQQPPQKAPESKKGGKKGKQPPKAGPTPAGRYVTVEQFFLEKYNIQTNNNFPVMNVGSRQNPSYLPVEVCLVVPGQPAGTKLTGNQTRAMLNFAVRDPEQNASSIVTKGAQVLGFGSASNRALTSFGLQVKPELITVTGRVLQSPRVFYKDKKMIETSNGSWNMIKIKFFKPAQLLSWTWLYIDGQRGRRFFQNQPLEDTVSRLGAKLSEMGVQTNPALPGMKITLSGNNTFEEIDKAIGALMDRHRPSLIFTISHNDDSEIYNSIKQICDLRRGVRNVNVLAQKFDGANDQYFANVGLKINLKLGGANQALNPAEMGIISEGKTMLVGIDVTHPSPGSAKTAPSVAGVVASIDSSLGQWPADIRIQTGRVEMVAALDAMVKTRLELWAKFNQQKYPNNIIVYRDGVSEGQYDTVIEQELPLIKNACEEVYPASATKQGLPKISIIVVGKRHHTRFYPTRAEDADRSMNPKNGTVVDRGVTEARNWDFYLQAHTALKGTARPAHYFTVWDEIFHAQKPKPPFQNAADILEDLTHRMCYLFGRATKSVSICPPAYYADLVCERARCYLSHVFDPTPMATPSGSVIGGQAGEAALTSSDVEIHPNVRNVMFYI